MAIDSLIFFTVRLPRVATFPGTDNCPNALPRLQRPLNQLPSSNRRSRKSHGTETDARKFVRYITLTVYALLFGIALLIATGQRGASNGAPVLLFTAFTLSQNAMVAIWAACFRGPAILPCAACTVASFGCWWILAGVPFIAFGDESEICWAIVVFTQSIATVLFTTCLDTFSKTSRRKYSGQSFHGVPLRRFSFSVGTLILWTSFAALGLFAVRETLLRMGWYSDTPQWTAVLIALLLAFLGSGFAVAWLATFRGAIWMIVAQRLLIMAPVFLFTTLFFHLSVSYFHPEIHTDLRTNFLLLAGQAGFGGLTLTATLNHTRR